jgi:hypothetical protein
MADGWCDGHSVSPMGRVEVYRSLTCDGNLSLSLAGGYISASTTCEKKGSSYPSHINTPICVLKMLY